MKKLNYLLIFLIIITIIISINAKSYENNIELKNPTVTKKTISFILKNNSKKNIYVKSVEIIIKDNENQTICKALIDVNQIINKEKTINIKEKLNYDLSNTNKIDYIIN